MLGGPEGVNGDRVLAGAGVLEHRVGDGVFGDRLLRDRDLCKQSSEEGAEQKWGKGQGGGGESRVTLTEENW